MLDEAVAYLVGQNARDAGIALLLDALDSAESLATLSHRGRVVPELAHPEIRELIVQRYRLIYRVKDDAVEILALVHGAREFDRLFGND